MTESKGTTPTEKYLGKLGERAFLSLWRHLNLYKQPGKELCDMLVVFRDYIIIFSVKEISFNNKGDPENDLIAWGRWYKNAIDKSAKQIFGAESWILRHSDRIYTDHQCKNKFLIDGNIKNMKIHRVCVAMGISRECAEYYGHGDTGSLIITNDLNGIEQHKNPFKVGHPNVEKGFVHIFDDFSLDIVFSEIDTIADFIDYLIKREKFFMSPQTPKFIASGEEELLALYLTDMNEDNQHDIVLPKDAYNMDFLVLDKKPWNDLVASPQYKRKKDANKISYLWDVIIKYYIDHGTTREGNNPFKDDIMLRKKQLQFFADMSRFERRMLANTYISVLKEFPPKEELALTRVTIVKEIPGKAFVFVVAPLNGIDIANSTNYQKYKEARRAHVKKYIYAVKLEFPHINCFIGLGAVPDNSDAPDIIVAILPELTEEQKKHIRKMKEKYSILVNPVYHVGKDKEYLD